ncbi:helix-turn-helix transcriptional regulator [Pseudomonas seleniipraecipitans]|uniref:Helix-turn-helix transcriptional regulator n=1 Tax=Phytopseudomonas seleniipraecipitans TaxID=640205 RepID=A0ABY5J7H7_9GAMM|nr:helix-turn-helix transcriptional regulator [Pseudomonas seleniipraecipitans]UUD62440.1 helix-turn-helix transcriptional regulator [Pseudomonas seleniipraecipitans]
MSPNGQTTIAERSVPHLERLPRPLYARNESLTRQTGTPRHSHTWVQLTYAIQGVLHVRTAASSFVAPPQRAIWIPAGLEHEVLSSPNTEMRSLYLDTASTDSPGGNCRVLGVDALTRELIRSFCELPVEYDETGPDGRLAQVLLDRLRTAPEVHLSLPLPSDPRLRTLCAMLQGKPDDDRPLAAWGESLGVSEKTLSRLFLRDTGLTFRAWRQRLRLLGALTPLEQGQRVTDVALLCGYESTSAFIAAFRQQFGATPGEFFRA